jgi:transposase InsO family protein
LGRGLTLSIVKANGWEGIRVELLDEHQWTSRRHLALAVFEWIEAWYNPKRRHSYCNMPSPVEYEAAHAA